MPALGQKRGRYERHGLSRRPEYHLWEAIVQRCENPHDKRYADYGGRGIRLYPAWRLSFKAFFDDVGSRPSREHQLDRIDNDRGYEPGNVRWTTRRVQQRNTRSNRRIEHDGELLLAVEWEERTGISAKTITTRLDRGWDVERALTTPSQMPWRKGKTPREYREVSR